VIHRLQQLAERVGHRVWTWCSDLVFVPVGHLLHPRLPDVDQWPVTLGDAVIAMYALLPLGWKRHHGLEERCEQVTLRRRFSEERTYARQATVHEGGRTRVVREIMHWRVQRALRVGTILGACHDDLFLRHHLCATQSPSGTLEPRLGRGVHRHGDVARVRPRAAPVPHLGDVVPRHPRLLICLNLGRPPPYRPALKEVRWIGLFVLRERNLEGEEERAGEDVVVRLEIGRVPRMGVDEELDRYARRGDDLFRGDFVRGGVGHGYYAFHIVLGDGGAAGKALGRGHFEVGGCRAEDLVGSVKGLERRVRGVFGRPFR
jgi:hypothetical protein